MSENNYSSRDTATLADTDILPVWQEGRNLKTALSALASFFLSTGRTYTGDVIGSILSEDGQATVLSPGTNGTDAEFWGSVNGGLTNPDRLLLRSDTIIESGALLDYSFYELFSADAPLVCTLPSLDPGSFYVITQADAGSQGHTVTLPTGVTFDGTNDIATFDAQYETLVLFQISSIRYVILGNFGSVGLSATP